MNKNFKTNVQLWVDRIQDHHWQSGRVWYRHANQLCQSLSDKHNVPFPNVVGVLAALSPQVSWEVNIRSCETIIEEGVIDKGYTGYRINVDKALQCLMSDPLDVLRGFKVLAFYRNILDPKRSKDVTVDTHIARVLFDEIYLDKKKIEYIFSKKGNTEGQEVVQEVAKRLRVIPHVLQASLWVCVRELAQARADKDQLSLYLK